MHKILFYNKFIYASTCFQHYMLETGVQNRIIQYLVSSHL